MQPDQQPLDFVGNSRIEIASRFVRQNDPGIVDDRPRNDDTLLFASAELMRVLATFVRETNAREDMKHFTFYAFPPVPRDVLGKCDIIEDVSIREQLEILKHYSQGPTQIRDIGAFDGVRTGISDPDDASIRLLLHIEQFQ